MCLKEFFDKMAVTKPAEQSIGPHPNSYSVKMGRATPPMNFLRQNAVVFDFAQATAVCSILSIGADYPRILGEVVRLKTHLRLSFFHVATPPPRPRPCR